LAVLHRCRVQVRVDFCIVIQYFVPHSVSVCGLKLKVKVRAIRGPTLRNELTMASEGGEHMTQVLAMTDVA
jgi:hypothetical protein